MPSEHVRLCSTSANKCVSGKSGSSATNGSAHLIRHEPGLQQLQHYFNAEKMETMLRAEDGCKTCWRCDRRDNVKCFSWFCPSNRVPPHPTGSVVQQSPTLSERRTKLSLSIPFNADMQTAYSIPLGSVKNPINPHVDLVASNVWPAR